MFNFAFNERLISYLTEIITIFDYQIDSYGNDNFKKRTY